MKQDCKSYVSNGVVGAEVSMGKKFVSKYPFSISTRGIHHTNAKWWENVFLYNVRCLIS